MFRRGVSLALAFNVLVRGVAIMFRKCGCGGAIIIDRDEMVRHCGDCFEPANNYQEKEYWVGKKCGCGGTMTMDGDGIVCHCGTCFMEPGGNGEYWVGEKCGCGGTIIVDRDEMVCRCDTCFTESGDTDWEEEEEREEKEYNRERKKEKEDWIIIGRGL